MSKPTTRKGSLPRRATPGRCLLAATALLLARPAVAAPQAVVLASTAPGYSLGQVLEDTKIEIPDGASTVFLLPTGQSVTVKGPYRGVLGPARTAPESRLAQLFPGRGTQDTEIGGTRSMAQADSQTLALDPSTGGTWCVKDGGRVDLVRPSDPAFATVELRTGRGERLARLDWTGTDRQPLPVSATPAAGELEVVSVTTGATRPLTLKVVTPAGRGEAAEAAAFAMTGCTVQARAALGRLVSTTVPLDLYLASDRGRYPRYRPGELVELVVQTNRDAYVYCTMRDMAGRVVPLFPPRPGEAFLSGHTRLALPGERLPFALRAGDALRDSEIRCIAAERDLAEAVPGLFATGALVPLPAESVAALDRALTDPSRDRVIVAQLILRVDQ